MKLVKEHINFERGLDPRDAMRTGDIIERLKNRYEKLLYNLKGLKLRQEFITDIAENIPSRMNRSCGWGNVQKRFFEFTDIEIDNFKKIISTYEGKIS